MDLDMAQRLVDRRRAAGLSQEALAEKLGVSRQAVSKWERSESSPDTDNFIALAALYGVSLDELLYGEVATESEPAAEPESDDADDTPRDEPRVNISWRDGINVHDPDKGEEVHVGWRGIHVDNERTGEHVHIGLDGTYIDTPEDSAYGTRQRSGIARAWSKFPFPAVLFLVYLILGIVYGSWGPGLFLIFAVPVYYALGDFIGRRQLSRLIGTLYSVAAVAWFFIMWLYVGRPHPAWTVLLTIPVMDSFLHWCRKQWKHRT